MSSLQKAAGTDNRPVSYTQLSTSQSSNAKDNVNSNNNEDTLHLSVPSKTLYSRVVKSYPKKEQAIVFPALDNTKIKDYINALGTNIGLAEIVAASRI